MKCSNCGKEIANDSKFCEYCGTRIAKKKNIKIIWIILPIIALLSGSLACYILLDEKREAQHCCSEYTLLTMVDSINYAIGFTNGRQIKQYYLAEDDSEEVILEFITELDNAYNGDNQKEYNENDNPAMESSFLNPQVASLAQSIGNAIRDQEPSGLFGVTGLETKFEIIKQGFYDGLHNNREYFDEESAQEYVTNALTQFSYRGEKEKGEQFLKKNAKRAGVKTTESGLQYEVLKSGYGARPSAYSTVKVHYEGTLIDGSVFDSSYDRGEPIEFPLDGVIKGWEEGLQLMHVGEKFKFYIPYELGYGEKGAGQSIPPYSVLIFTVELLNIK